MRKFLLAINKNLKILFRLKTSLIAMILGPLLVIFLIGFAFNSTAQFQINIGYSAADNSELTQEFIENLNKEYTTKSFSSIEECTFELQQGIQHVCIDFPENFVIQEQNTIDFFVDNSRVNIVYTVLASVSENIGLQSDQVSQNLAQALIDTLDTAGEDIDEVIGNVVLLKQQIRQTDSQTEEIGSSLGEINLGSITIPTDFESDLQEIITRSNTTKNSLQEIIDEGLNLTEEIKDLSSNPGVLIAADNLEFELNAMSSEVNSGDSIIRQEVNNLRSSLQQVDTAISQLENSLQETQTRVSSNVDSLQNIRGNLETTINSLDNIQNDLEEIYTNINSVEIRSSEQIVNPISTRINTVSAENNQLFVLFPYVLLLIIMFGGLMLSSTLVVVEKRSKASFRVFTTPTTDQFYIWTTFMTSFIIILVQLIIIYLLMNAFFIDLIGANIEVTIPLLIVASSLFIMLGMALGYLMPSQQGANMASISLGAIFLFLSNIMLPLETVSSYLQTIAYYNPFVMSAEVLRQGIIFQTGFQEVWETIAYLLGYIVIIFILIVVFQRLSKTKFMHRLTKKQKKGKKTKELIIGETTIKTEKDFVKAVASLTEEEFKKKVIKNAKIRTFVRKEISDAIGRRLKKLSKKELLQAITEKNKELIETSTKK